MGLEQAAIFAFAGPSIKIATRHSRCVQHAYDAIILCHTALTTVVRNRNMIVTVSCKFLIE
jgi:hypothetical protein